MRASTKMQKLTIAIDGPSGSGKSSLARRVASMLGYLYMDSGAMYRAVALKALRRGLSLSNEPAVSAIARESWRFLYRATLEQRHWHVLEQDREMLTNIPADAHKREMLYQHDVGVARMRRMLSQQVKNQIAAEDLSAVRTAV